MSWHSVTPKKEKNALEAVLTYREVDGPLVKTNILTDIVRNGKGCVVTCHSVGFIHSLVAMVRNVVFEGGRGSTSVSVLPCFILF